MHRGSSQVLCSISCWHCSVLHQLEQISTVLQPTTAVAGSYCTSASSLGMLLKSASNPIVILPLTIQVLTWPDTCLDYSGLDS